MSMRLVMEISGARAVVAGGTECGGRIRAARIVGERNTREPVRRNGTRPGLGRDSVGRERKFDSHRYFGPLGLGITLLNRWGARWSLLAGPGRGGATVARIAKAAAGLGFCRVRPSFQQAINGAQPGRPVRV